MRKTIALFGLALVLLVTALVVGIRKPVVPETVTPQPPPPPLTFAAPEAGNDSVQIRDLVSLDARLSNGHVRANQSGNLSLLMDLVASDDGARERSSMAVAIVIDRSGSMAGEKIQKARQAAKQFAARLTDDDQLALVTYSSDYSVDLPLMPVRGNRARIERAIDEILDGGGTDIGSGLSAGLQQLRTPASPIRRLLLVSDGNANQGITDPQALADMARQGKQDGITVSTLGVGLDFNEDLLTLMAQSAGGGYYYARDAAAIAQAFDKELSGLTRLAARNVEVGLELGQGVSITEIFGYRTEMRRGRVVIPVGDMAAGERRRIMLQLQVAPGAEGKAVDVSRLVLAFSSASGADTREHQGTLSVVATTDEGRLAGSEKRDVSEAFEAALAARARERAAFSFQAGNKAAALDQIQTQLRITRAKNAVMKSVVLETQVKEMEGALQGFSSAPVDSDTGKDMVKSEKLRAREVFAY